MMPWGKTVTFEVNKLSCLHNHSHEKNVTWCNLVIKKHEINPLLPDGLVKSKETSQNVLSSGRQGPTSK
jgi:hypothetical protein